MTIKELKKLLDFDDDIEVQVEWQGEYHRITKNLEMKDDKTVALSILRIIDLD